MSDDADDRFAALAKKDEQLRGGADGDGRDDTEADDGRDDGGPPDHARDRRDAAESKDSNESSDSHESCESDGVGESAEDGDPEGAEGGPAFEFGDDLRQSVYVRPESWAAFEDAVDFEVERKLREYGIRDLSRREVHDAMARLAAEHPDRLTELVLEARGIDPD